MNERRTRRDTEKVVKKVLKLVEQFDTIGREEFSAVNREVMEHVSKNTGISIEQVLQKMSAVIHDLSQRIRPNRRESEILGRADCLPVCEVLEGIGPSLNQAHC